MKEHIEAYKTKLKKGICEYMEGPASERSASVIRSMIECWNMLSTMEETPVGKTDYPFTAADAQKWNSYMQNSDGTTGGHWTVEQTNGVANSVGVVFEHITPECWNTAMNMMFSDYGNVAAYFGVSTAEFYGEMAKAFLFDKDGPKPEEKMGAYYHCIVCNK